MINNLIAAITTAVIGVAYVVMLKTGLIQNQDSILWSSIILLCFYVIRNECRVRDIERDK